MVAGALLTSGFVCLGKDAEGMNPGECSDGADNDADGAFDCDDDSCTGSQICSLDSRPVNSLTEAEQLDLCEAFIAEDPAPSEPRTVDCGDFEVDIPESTVETCMEGVSAVSSCAVDVATLVECWSSPPPTDEQICGDAPFDSSPACDEVASCF
jgi:hypothetical protein